MLKAERQRQIANAVRERGTATVAALSEKFDASEITIRRDLSELDAMGVLQRAHGGAVALPLRVREPPVVQRMDLRRFYKQQIAHLAASLVSDHESVFIGSGTTTAYLAREICSRRELTVVTNALTVAQELATAAGVTIVVMGGLMRPSELSLVGHITEIALREVRVDKVFLGVPAISVQDGLTNDYLPEVMTDRAIIEMAPELIVLVDHSKIGKIASAYVAPIERVAVLVTDREADSSFLNQLAQKGIRVIQPEQ